MTMNDEKRQQWFDRGVKALAAARPTAPRVYCCPLCLRGFDLAHMDLLSIEDVPPRSVGGRPLLLTCKQCNNRHGTELDAHIKAGRDLGEILQGSRETWGRLRVGDDRMAVKGTVFGESNELREVAGKSCPAEREAVERFFHGLAGTDATGSEFHFEFAIRHDEWRERVGWLRVAYLYLSALLGHAFVLREVMHPIRDQFQRPDEELVPQIIKTMADPVCEDRIVSVSQPNDLRSFVVQLRRWTFFFPGFVGEDSFYDRLTALPEKGELLLTGNPLAMPREPVYECDFHPEFARLLALHQDDKLAPGGTAGD
jgi:hypothetical protein